MSVYALTLYTSGFLAPVFAGFINDGMGWQWVMVCVLPKLIVSTLSPLWGSSDC